MVSTKSSLTAPSLLLLPFRHGDLVGRVAAEADHAPRSQITSPPQLPPRLLRRRQLQSTCLFGRCGNTCLKQGAFCCNPAGTAIDIPNWICDSGECVTSIRGMDGIVDCYDPNNPQGTTRSCIDNGAATTCQSAVSCHTCSAGAPFCHWETYIASGSPTLSRFSCVSSSRPDFTFYAATIAGITATSSHASSLVSPTASSTTRKTKTLGKGPIIGVAVGVLALASLLAFLTWFIVSRRRKVLRKDILTHGLPDACQDISRSGIRTPRSMPPPQYLHSPPPPDVKLQDDGGGDDRDQAVVAELPAADVPDVQVVEGHSELENNSVCPLSQTSWLALDMHRIE